MIQHQPKEKTVQQMSLSFTRAASLVVQLQVLSVCSDLLHTEQSCSHKVNLYLLLSWLFEITLIFSEVLAACETQEERQEILTDSTHLLCKGRLP